MKLIKRNGSEVVFDISKIEMAITKANETVEEADRMTPVQIISAMPFRLRISSFFWLIELQILLYFAISTNFHFFCCFIYFSTVIMQIYKKYLKPKDKTSKKQNNLGFVFVLLH